MATSSDPETREDEHVHKVYSSIATHFSDTRYNPWPRVAEFLSSLPPGSLVADVGCGNGKYLGINKDVCALGSDMCPELVAIARGRGHEALVCNCLELPYRSCTFDAAISIAVIHHLSTEERRKKALGEMARLLQPGGQLLVYVWAMEQMRKKFSEQDVMVPWHLQPHYSPGHDPTHSAKKKKEKRRRGKSKQSKTKTERGKDMEDIDDEKTDSSSHNKVVASSDLLRTPSPTSLLVPTTSNIVEPVPSSKDNDFSVSSPHASSDDKHAFDLQQHGFRTFYRYYHVFVDKELIELCKRVPSLKILDYWYDHDNWCLLAQKLD